MKFEVTKDVEGPRKNALRALEIATALRHAQHSAFVDVYKQKVEEAQSGQYDLLAQEAQIRGVPVAILAAQVLERHEQAQVKGRQIELQRVEHKQAITQAYSRDQVQAAINAYFELCEADGLDMTYLRPMVTVNDPSW